MTREEMERVLGMAIGDGFIDLLVGYGVANVEVIHERPLLEGPVKLTKANRDQVRPARYSSGKRKTFTGHQMAGHRRDIQPRYSEVNPDFQRYYFDQRGGRTVVTLRIGDTDYIGEARVWHEDTFIKEDGRRLALVRAALKISPNISETMGVLATATLANPADPRTGVFPCKEYSVAPRPKERLGFSLGTIGAGKTKLDFFELARRIQMMGSPGGPLRDFFARVELWKDVIPQHVVLKARALRKLNEAEKLDAQSEARRSSKKERKRLRHRAQSLREQAVADAEVSARLAPEASIHGARFDKVVFDEYSARNEA